MPQELIKEELPKVERCLMVQQESCNVLPNSNEVCDQDWFAPESKVTVETKA